MKCPKCNKDEWRANVYQTVDVEIDEEFYPTDNGLNFSDPEVDKKSVVCINCGFEPHLITGGS